ncbi:CopG family transcriptional regulator [Synechococcus sp. AH-551-N23]|nr:CopG family transcriptional regulator [Synechococcus sp. AH-551-N23]
MTRCLLRCLACISCRRVDVRIPVRERLRQRWCSVGHIVSALARQALSRSADGGGQNVLEQRSGLPQLPVKASGGVVS